MAFQASRPNAYGAGPRLPASPTFKQRVPVKAPLRTECWGPEVNLGQKDQPARFRRAEAEGQLREAKVPRPRNC